LRPVDSTLKPLVTVIFIYTATVLALLTIGLLSRGMVAESQISVSLILLYLLTLYLRRLKYRAVSEPRAESVSAILLLLLIAMAARTVFIGLFRFPAEKVPVIFLVVLTNLLVDGRPLSAIGLGRVRLTRAVALGVSIGLALYYLNLLTSASIGYLTGRPMDMVWRPPDPYGLVWSAVNAFVLAALSEELLFRGYIQGRLEGVVGSNNSLIYSALLFGFWHIVWGLPYIGDPWFALAYTTSYMFFAGLAGILLGGLYRSTRSIVPPVIVHGLWNTLTGISPAYRLVSPSAIQSILEPLSFGLIILALYLATPSLARLLKLSGVQKVNM